MDKKKNSLIIDTGDSDVSDPRDPPPFVWAPRRGRRRREPSPSIRDEPEERFPATVSTSRSASPARQRSVSPERRDASASSYVYEKEIKTRPRGGIEDGSSSHYSRNY
jgi:hypothetical protein